MENKNALRQRRALSVVRFFQSVLPNHKNPAAPPEGSSSGGHQTDWFHVGRVYIITENIRQANNNSTKNARAVIFIHVSSG
ncbi:MAG: hypothetical protein ACOYYF_17705 [Chloroflexota bacterium]|nr:hypothetical protein [Chloroflexota bacterium]MBI5704969.1 hypothetical protein [Chloroflexota bacterium]